MHDRQKYENEYVSFEVSANFFLGYILLSKEVRLCYVILRNANIYIITISIDNMELHLRVLYARLVSSLLTPRHFMQCSAHTRITTSQIN